MEPFPLPGQIEVAHRTADTVRRLRYRAFKGSVIWDYDTAHDDTTTHGVSAKGGARWIVPVRWSREVCYT